MRHQQHYLQGETLTNIAVEKGISQPTMSRRADQALEELWERLRRKGLLVATRLLGGFMTHTANAAPAAVLAELGKMALASSGTGAAGVGSGATSSALKTALAAAVAMVVVGIASWLLSKTDASQPHASKLAAATGVAALPTSAELLDKYTAHAVVDGIRWRHTDRQAHNLKVVGSAGSSRAGDRTLSLVRG